MEILSGWEQKILVQLALKHPLPWKKERDSVIAWRVVDSSGVVVTKLNKEELADKLILWAEETDRNLTEEEKCAIREMWEPVCCICKKPVIHNDPVKISIGRDSFCGGECVNVWEDDKCLLCSKKRCHHFGNKNRCRGIFERDIN